MQERKIITSWNAKLVWFPHCILENNYHVMDRLGSCHHFYFSLYLLVRSSQLHSKYEYATKYKMFLTFFFSVTDGANTFEGFSLRLSIKVHRPNNFRHLSFPMWNCWCYQNSYCNHTLHPTQVNYFIILEYSNHSGYNKGRGGRSLVKFLLGRINISLE